MSDHRFCQILLADAREQAKAAGIKLPKRITTNKSSMGTRTQYQIVTDEDPAGPWIQHACCSWFAKSEWIVGLVEAGKPDGDAVE